MSSTPSLGALHISKKEGKKRSKELSGNVLGVHFRGKWGAFLPAQVSKQPHPQPSAQGQHTAMGMDNAQGPCRPSRTLQCAGFSRNDPPTNLD